MVSENENHKILNSFFKEEYHSLKAYVNARIDNAAHRDAEDVIQDVAFKLFSKADSLSPIDNITGYVYHAIRNKVIDLLRKKKPNVPFEDEMEQRLTDFSELVYGSTDDSYPEDLKAALKRAIANLKPVYRDIIVAIDFEDYSYKELSEETGVPAGTLMSRRHRALSLLLKELETKNLDIN